MDVRVDETRHDKFVDALDDLRALWDGNIVFDCGNTVALDQNVPFERRRALRTSHGQHSRTTNEQRHKKSSVVRERGFQAASRNPCSAGQRAMKDLPTVSCPPSISWRG